MPKFPIPAAGGALPARDRSRKRSTVASGPSDEGPATIAQLTELGFEAWPEGAPAEEEEMRASLRLLSMTANISWSLVHKTEDELATALLLMSEAVRPPKIAKLFEDAEGIVEDLAKLIAAARGRLMVTGAKLLLESRRKAARREAALRKKSRSSVRRARE